MEEKIVLEFTEKYGLIREGMKTGAAVSGGADSMVMLVILKKLGFDVCALHFEHGIRSEAESAGDMRFVESYCAEHGIPFICERAKVPELREQGESMETAARRLRYAFFERAAKEHGLKRIATAHHADDNAETVIMNILRGSGVKGIEGIRPQRGIYIRPMLPLTKEQIEKYAEKNGIPFVTDSTNAEEDYTRNKIRMNILPVFRQLNPSYGAAFLRTSELAAEQNDAFNLIAASELERITLPCEYGLALNAPELRKMSGGLASAVIREAISRTCPLKDIEKKHFETVLELAGSKGTGKSFTLEGKFTAFMSYNRLIIAPKAVKIIKEGEYPLTDKKITAVFDAELVRIDSDKPVFGEPADLIQFFDASAIEGAICRTRREGDMFSPLGVNGKKKLKDWMIDRKIPAFMRDGIPLIARGNDVLWVIGYGISSHARITPKTKKIIGLAYRP